VVVVEEEEEEEEKEAGGWVSRLKNNSMFVVTSKKKKKKAKKKKQSFDLLGSPTSSPRSNELAATRGFSVLSSNRGGDRGFTGNASVLSPELVGVAGWCTVAPPSLTTLLGRGDDAAKFPSEPSRPPPPATPPPTPPPPPNRRGSDGESAIPCAASTNGEVTAADC
jgi:hypothetical protein